MSAYVRGACAPITKDTAAYNTARGDWAVTAQLKNDPYSSATFWIFKNKEDALRAAAAINEWPHALTELQMSAVKALIAREITLKWSQRRNLTSEWPKLASPPERAEQEDEEEEEGPDDLLGRVVQLTNAPIIPSPDRIFKGMYSGPARVDSIEDTRVTLSFDYMAERVRVNMHKDHLLKMIGEKRDVRPFELNPVGSTPVISGTLANLLQRMPESSKMDKGTLCHRETATFACTFGVDGYGADRIERDPGQPLARMIDLLMPLTTINVKLGPSWDVPNAVFHTFPTDPAALARMIKSKLASSSHDLIDLEPPPPPPPKDATPLATAFLALASTPADAEVFLTASIKITMQPEERDFASGDVGRGVRLAALESVLAASEELDSTATIKDYLDEHGRQNASSLSMLLFRFRPKRTQQREASTSNPAGLSVNVTQNNGDLGEKGDQIVADVKLLNSGANAALVHGIADIARDKARAKQSLLSTLVGTAQSHPVASAAIDRILNTEQDLSKCFAAAGEPRSRPGAQHHSGPCASAHAPPTMSGPRATHPLGNPHVDPPHPSRSMHRTPTAGHAPRLPRPCANEDSPARCCAHTPVHAPAKAVAMSTAHHSVGCHALRPQEQARRPLTTCARSVTRASKCSRSASAPRTEARSPRCSASSCRSCAAATGACSSSRLSST